MFLQSAEQDPGTRPQERSIANTSRKRMPYSDERVPLGLQLLQKCSCALEIFCVKAFSKPLVNVLKHRSSFIGLLFRQQAGKMYCCGEFLCSVLLSSGYIY